MVFILRIFPSKEISDVAIYLLLNWNQIFIKFVARPKIDGFNYTRLTKHLERVMYAILYVKGVVEVFFRYVW